MTKTEAWIEKNQKVLLGVIGAVAVCVSGYFAYQQYIQAPNEAEALNEMYQAQNFWSQALTAPAKDLLYHLSLHGRGGNFDLSDISEMYSGMY